MKLIKMILAAIALLSSFSVYAQTEDTQLGPNCDLAYSGIGSKEKVISFMSALKAAALNRDKTKLSQLVIFPLRINGDKTINIFSEKDLEKNYSLVFSENVIRAIDRQTLVDTFCRDTGLMIGNGEAWVNQDPNGKIGIFVINR